MQRATVVLPQPDSPTSEKVSPRLIVKVTPSNALTAARGLPCRSRSTAACETSKWRLRSLTSSSTSCSGIGGLGNWRVLPTGRLGFLGRQQLGPLPAALIQRLAAARIERATRRDRVQSRHRAVDLLQAPAPTGGARDRG